MWTLKIHSLRIHAFPVRIEIAPVRTVNVGSDLVQFLEYLNLRILRDESV